MIDASFTDASVHPAWLTAGARYVASWIEYQLRASQQPGCAIVIAHRDELVLDIVLGVADVEQQVPLSPGNLFRVASHNKAFTAAGMLLLCERGVLSLDNEAGRYVEGLHPELAGATIRQVLANMAGIRRDGPGYASLRKPFPTRSDLKAWLRDDPILAPGSRGKYSNLGYGLAGLIIEAVTREPYGDWLQREVIAAAGLERSFANASSLPRERLAHGHGEPVLLGRRQTWPSDQDIDALDPAFGLVSTPADLCRFFLQLDPDAANSFLSRNSRLEMLQDRWEDPVGPEPRSYGLGVTKGVSGGWHWYGHIGGYTGTMSRTLVVPRLGLALSVVVNAQDGRAPAWADGALKILKWFQAEFSQSSYAADWHGRWWNAWGVVDLVAIGDRVILANPAQLDPFALAPVVRPASRDGGRLEGCSAFLSDGEKVALLRSTDGAATALDIAGDLWLPEHVYAAELAERAERWTAAA